MLLPDQAPAFIAVAGVICEVWSDVNMQHQFPLQEADSMAVHATQIRNGFARNHVRLFEP